MSTRGGREKADSGSSLSPTFAPCASEKGGEPLFKAFVAAARTPEQSRCRDLVLPSALSAGPKPSTRGVWDGGWPRGGGLTAGLRSGPQA